MFDSLPEGLPVEPVFDALPVLLLELFVVPLLVASLLSTVESVFVLFLFKLMFVKSSKTIFVVDIPSDSFPDPAVFVVLAEESIFELLPGKLLLDESLETVSTGLLELLSDDIVFIGPSVPSFEILPVDSELDVLPVSLFEELLDESIFVSVIPVFEVLSVSMCVELPDEAIFELFSVDPVFNESLVPILDESAFESLPCDILFVGSPVPMFEEILDESALLSVFEVLSEESIFEPPSDDSMFEESPLPVFESTIPIIDSLFVQLSFSSVSVFVDEPWQPVPVFEGI